MKTTGIFKIHRYEIPFKKYGDTIKLVPFSDIHFEAPLFASKVFDKFCTRYHKDKSAFFLGGGDYTDELSTSERSGMVNANYHDATIKNIEKSYLERLDRLYEKISFMKGRTIGLCEGNHYYQLGSGQTTTNLLCQKLDTEYLGVKTFVELILRHDEHHAHRLVVCMHHGEGGGRRSSSSVSKLENMAHTHDADIILQGHDHRKNHIEVPILGITSANRGMPNVIQKVKYCARTGGFLKGYVHNSQSYVADANLPPNGLGNVEFHITPKMIRNRIPVKGKGKHNKDMEKRWLNVEFHSCNYSEH